MRLLMSISGSIAMQEKFPDIISLHSRNLPAPNITIIFLLMDALDFAISYTLPLIEKDMDVRSSRLALMLRSADMLATALVITSIGLGFLLIGLCLGLLIMILSASLLEKTSVLYTTPSIIFGWPLATLINSPVVDSH